MTRPSLTDVEHRGLLDHAQRVVPRQDHRGGHQLDRLGLGRDIGQRLQRIGAGGVVGEMMLDSRREVEAHRLGFHHQLGFLAEELHIALAA